MQLRSPHGIALSALLASWFGARSAAAEPSSAVEWTATIYAANVAVALNADRLCRGARCAERYYSLVPVLGGLAQLSHGGVDFHDTHHGRLCVPLTVAAVAGQAAGIAAHLARVELSLATPAGGRLRLSVVGYQDVATAAGLGLAWEQ